MDWQSAEQEAQVVGANIGTAQSGKDGTGGRVMRLIDADALMDEINWLIGQAARYNRVSYEDFVMRIKNAPTIEIVRCGECKWFDNREGCFFSTAEIDSDDFCSFGERRER